MAERDIAPFISWYPLRISEETSGAKMVKGTISVRMIYSEHGTTLRGLDEGIRRMSLGEHAKLHVRQDYAYCEVHGTAKVDRSGVERLRVVVRLLSQSANPNAPIAISRLPRRAILFLMSD